MTTDVCFFVPRLGGGGAERAVLNLANELARFGLAVDVVLALRAGHDYRPDLDPAVRVIELARSRTSVSLPRLRSYLGRARPRSLYAPLASAAVVALVASRLTRPRPRVVVGVQNTFSRILARPGTLKVRLLCRIAPRLYRLADEVVAVSRGVADDLDERFGLSRVHVISNPMSSAAIHAKAAATAQHPWFDDTRPVLLAVGRLTEQKNYPLMLEALELVRRERDARLVVLGEGEERAALGSLAERLGIAASVDFRGFVDNPFPYMRRAQLLVLSSDYEGLPSVIIEALTLGLPCVSTDCPHGPREILGDGEFGTLVPTGDAAALARGILHALDTPQDPACLSRRARRYGAEAIARRFAALLVPDHPAACAAPSSDEAKATGPGTGTAPVSRGLP